MYVACSSLCFARAPLPEVLRKVREMAFQKVDLAVHESGPHLRPSEVTADLPRVVQKLRGANLAFSAFHVEFGSELDETQLCTQMSGVARLARAVAAPLITIRAGPIGSDLDAETERLSLLATACTVEGVMLCVETHSQTVTADPCGAVELCHRVPGLGITLDPTHYMVGPHKGDLPEDLYKLVRHVRVRDSGHEPDQFQMCVGQGKIEYGRIIAKLERLGYNRVVAIDYHDIADSPFPVLPEVRKLKYLIESMI